MALIQHRQIRDRLTSSYVEHLDLSDLTEDKKQDASLSRATAALSLVFLADIDVQTACNCVVDGTGDNGIDAIYFDPNEKTLYLVQAKWNNNHTGSIDNGSVLKFLQGVKDLINSKYTKFNAKVNSHRATIDNALANATKVALVTSYTGSGSFSEENRASIEEFLHEVDETGDLVVAKEINQSIFHNYISSGAQGGAISESIQIFDWGWIEEPARAYYGKIAASDLVSIYRRHGPKLFSKNIRMFLGSDSSVNRGIAETLKDNPELFWYYNNGITALADSISRLAIGGANREAGQFNCQGITIVNGAQTVGSLSSVSEHLQESLQSAMVPIRIIQTLGASESFSSQITKNNNTQNKIDPRNFVALDPNQERLRTEFLVDGIYYEYRQGEVEQSAGTHLGLIEATLALACTDPDVDLSTQAKREIGRLWEDIARPPYRKLFNSGQTSDNVWQRVTAYRRLDAVISNLQIEAHDKERSIAIHGNRFLTHLCYNALVSKNFSANLDDVTDDEMAAFVRYSFETLSSHISEKYTDNYLASLFKNQSKCRVIANDLMGPLIAA